jgi:hypothetical protein
MFKLFGSKDAKVKFDISRWKKGDLEKASVAEIADILKQPIPPSVPSVPISFMAELTKRLLEIVYEDESVTQEERHQASVLAPIVIQTTEKGLDDPSALAKYQAAYRGKLEYAQKWGIGTLNRKLLRLPADQVFSEVVKREYAAQLHSVPSDILGKARPEFIKALLRDRRPNQEYFNKDQTEDRLFQKIVHGNAVNTAGWLVLLKDPTALYFFSTGEQKIIGNYLNDHERAHLLLVDIGVVSVSKPLSFTPIPEPKMVSELMFHSSLDENTALAHPERGDERESLSFLDREARRGAHLMLSAYRLFVWRKTIENIYGSGFLAQVNAGSLGSSEVTGITRRYDELYTLANEQEISFDQLILADIMYDYLDRTLPEEMNDKILQACARVMRNEMFYFPPYVRYLIRYLIHGQEKAVEAHVEDVVA